MAQTYVADLLSISERYQVRFLIGDNVPCKMVLQDDEIDWLLTQEANVYMAAAAAADSLAQKVATTQTSTTGSGGVTRKRIGNTDLTYASGTFSRTVNDYKELASLLRLRGSAHMMPFAGGISVTDKDMRESDTDRPRDGFRRGMFDDGPSGLANDGGRADLD